MINLYLAYTEAGGTKVARTDRYPIPYYMMDFIGRYIKTSDASNEFDSEKVNQKLAYLFSAREIFYEVYNKLCEIIEDYGDEFKSKGIDYSTMTKNREIDSNLINTLVKTKLKEAKRNNWTHFIEYMS